MRTQCEGGGKKTRAFIIYDNDVTSKKYASAQLALLMLALVYKKVEVWICGVTQSRLDGRDTIFFGRPLRMAPFKCNY